jgi:hypothetical protein
MATDVFFKNLEVEFGIFLLEDYSTRVILLCSLGSVGKGEWIRRG